MPTSTVLSEIQRRLLDRWQRGFPLESRPYHRIASQLGVSSDWVLTQLSDFLADGTVSRVGAVIRPNVVGASTLAAVSVPEEALESVATTISGFEEVNHNYQREHHFNLWFVAMAAGQPALQQALDRIERSVNTPLLRLPLIRDYHIDLGFTMFTHAPEAGQGATQLHAPTSYRLPSRLSQTQRCVLITELQKGIPLCKHPYTVLGERIGWSEQQTINSLYALISEGIVSRLGIIVRHRKLGFRANAMVVWDVPDEQIDALGQAIGGEAAVTLCYQRPRVEGCWPYNLFCMIHGRDRASVEATIASIAQRHNASTFPREVLFSTRCFKQRGARYRFPEGQSAHSIAKTRWASAAVGHG